jgi:hypothetical protein
MTKDILEISYAHKKTQNGKHMKSPQTNPESKLQQTNSQGEKSKKSSRRKRLNSRRFRVAFKLPAKPAGKDFKKRKFLIYL